MPNNQKIKKVEYLTEKLKSSSALYFTKYTGMDVGQATSLRQSFTDNDIEYYISKNTLTSIACEKAGFDKKSIDKFLTGQIGIAYAKDDPTVPARIIKNFSKENECIEVIGLYFDGKLYDPEKYVEIAALPTQDILLTKVITSLSFPMKGVLNCLQFSMTSFVNVLNNLKEQKD